MKRLVSQSWLLTPLIIVLAPLLLGSVHQATTALLLSGGCVACLLFATKRLDNGKPIPYSPLVLVGAALILYLLFQTLPLPPFLVGWLSPEAARLKAQAWEVIGVSGLWSPLSLEHVSTFWEAARLAGLVLLFWVIFALSLKPEKASLIQRAVGLSGVIVVILGLIQWASGSDRILGFYTSPDVQTILGSGASLGFVTPLINNNHAAGLMVLSAMVLLGLSLGRERERLRPVAFGGFLITVVGVLASRSRGGLLALAAGVIVFTAIRYLGPRLRRKGSRYTRTTTAIGIALFLLTTLLLLITYDVFVLEPLRSPLLADPRTDLKVQLWQAAMPILSDFPVFGIGKGAFPFVAAAYLGSTLENTTWYVESLPLQFLLDLGLLPGILFLGAAAAMLIPLFGVGLRYSRWIGMTTGLMALGLHNLVDFNLEITGIAIPATATLAVLAARVRARRLKYRMSGDAPKVTAPTFSAIAIGVTLFLFLGAAWMGISGTRAAHAGLQADCLSPSIVSGSGAPPAACMDAARGAVVQHPADHHLFKLGSAVALLSKDLDGARAWVDRAIQLCPGCLSPEILSAEIHMSVRQLEKAAAIYASIFTRRPGDTRRIFQRLTQSRHPPEVLARLFTGSPLKANEFADYLIREHKPKIAGRFLVSLLTLEGKQPERLLKLGRILLLQGQPDKADRLATEILGLFPDSPDGFALQGMVETSRGNCLTAIAMLKEARSRKPNHLQLSLDELLCQAKVSTFQEFDRSAAHLRRQVSGLTGPSYQFHLASAIRFAREDRTSEALHELDQAALFLPSSPVLPKVRGRIHYKIGDFQRAAQAFRKVLQLKPGDPEALDMLQKLELP